MDTSGFSPYDVAAASSAPLIPWAATTPYEKWCAAQAVPIIKGFFIEDLTTVQTAAWQARGAHGAIVCLDGADDTNGSYVLKIDGGDSTVWLKHMYEELFHAVAGSGIIELRAPDRIVRQPWSAGAVFAPPLNREYRLIADLDATLYCVNAAPPVMNLFHNEPFVVDNPFTFIDRWDGKADYFTSNGRMWRRPDGAGVWETTYVDDVNSFELPPLARRGGSGKMVTFQFGEGSLIAHISEFESGSYKKAHRHGPGANIVILAGEGYSLLWERDGDEPHRVDWRPNSVFVPPDMWWHQHFNPGLDPARYVALRWGSRHHLISHAYEGTLADRREGGNQIEYDEQAPGIDLLFREERRRRGVTVGT